VKPLQHQINERNGAVVKELEKLEAQVKTENKNERSSGPRSKIVEAIAVLLLARPLRAAEIAEALGYSSRYVSSYLSYWRTRGIFDYENGYWTLTEKGEEYARNIIEKEMSTRIAQYTALARKILNDNTVNVRQAINHNNPLAASSLSGELQSFIATININASKKKQDTRTLKTCVRALLSSLELTSDEKTILEELLNHYIKWNSTYTYIDQLEKTLEADRAWLLTTIRLLQSKNLVYIYTDKRLGIRIGLSRKLRNYLRSCST